MTTYITFSPLSQGCCFFFKFASEFMSALCLRTHVVHEQKQLPRNKHWYLNHETEKKIINLDKRRSRQK